MLFANIIIWFLCGVFSVHIWVNNFRLKKGEDYYDEFFIFIIGPIGLIFILRIWINKKY